MFIKRVYFGLHPSFFVMLQFLHALNCVPGMNYKTLACLWERFRDWRYAWESAAVEELFAAGIKQEIVLNIIEAKKQCDTDTEMAYLWENDIVILSRESKEYPSRLSYISRPPLILYRKGAPLDSSFKHIAIVGTRQPSTYGEKMAYSLASAIAAQNGIVVSGLAIGIDAVAHFSAVSQKKPTIGVLASGIGIITPSCHERFVEQILANNGSIISEYPPCDPAYQGRFLERNRLISGLSQAVIVIEAGIKSGALSTANHAILQKRELYALVGEINKPKTAGCLQLISKGARPITNIGETMQQLGFQVPIKNAAISLSSEEKTVFQTLQEEPSSTQDLMIKIHCPLNKINVILSQLELKGVIKRNKALLWETVE